MDSLPLCCGTPRRLLAMMLALTIVAPLAGAEETAVAGQCVTETSLLLRRKADTEAWQVVAAKDELRAGELLVGGPGVVLLSKNGGVQLSFLGEMQGTSTNPVRETAVILHDNKEADLDVTLDRGRIDLINKKQKGPARVRVRIRDKQGEVVLENPGDRIAVEVYGRWLAGVPFRKEPKPGEVPAMALVIVVLKGEVEIKGKEKHFVLTSPPGPALIVADSLGDTSVSPQFLEKAPAWAEGKETAHQKVVKKVLAQFRRLAVEKSVGEALDAMLDSEDPLERRGGVFIAGATDDLLRLGKALSTTKHADVWDNGVLALRHWIGRGPGQDQKLYQALVDKAKLPGAQAETVMHLLHSFGEDELGQPVTYQALLQLLEHDRLAIRGLAYWHLKRLAPDGEEFGYDPLAPAEKRAAAIKRWRELIPQGKLPPAPKPSMS